MLFTPWLRSLKSPSRRTRTIRSNRRSIPLFAIECLEDRTLLSVSFASAINLPIPSTTPGTADVVVADFNKDGNLDIVTTFNDGAYPNNPSRIAVFLATGPASFAPPIILNPGPGCWTSSGDSLQVADFNNDGNLDLSITHGGSNALCFGNKVSIHLGDGLGGFAAPGIIFSTGGSIAPHVIGDFNGDGNPDIVISTFDSGLVRTHLGSGTGTFSGTVSSFAGKPSGFVVEDFNGDGRLDLATASSQGADANTVRILFGTGTGSFTVSATFPLGGATGIESGDFDGDGILDLAVSSQNPGTVSLLRGLGGGSFAPPVSFAAGPAPVASELEVGDFDGDGKLDVAVGNPGSGSISVLLGDGLGGLAAPVAFPTPPPGNGIEAADVDGDGRLDLVATSASGVLILLNTTAGSTAVNGLDASIIFNNLTGFFPAGIDNPFDLNRSDSVNGLDASIVFNNLTGFFSLILFTPPAPSTAPLQLEAGSGVIAEPETTDTSSTLITAPTLEESDGLFFAPLSLDDAAEIDESNFDETEIDKTVIEEGQIVEVDFEEEIDKTDFVETTDFEETDFEEIAEIDDLFNSVDWLDWVNEGF